MQGSDGLAALPTAQIIVCESQADFDAVTRANLGQIVLQWEPTDVDEAFAPLAGRDVIALGDLPLVWIADAKPRRLRVSKRDENDRPIPIPATVTGAWISSNIEPYNVENPTLRHVQPLAESAAQAPSPAVGVIPLSPTAEPDAADPLDAFLGDDPAEDMPEDHPSAETLPDDAYDNVVPIASRIWQPGRDLDGWGKPIDLLGRAIPPEFDLSLLPGYAADFIGDNAERSGFDPGGGVVSWLSCVGGVADDAFKFSPKWEDSKFRVRPKLWGMVVGEASVLKNAMLEMCTDHVDHIDMEERIKSVLEDKKHLMRMGIYEKEVSAYQSAMAKDGDKTGLHEPEEPTRDPTREFKLNSLTIEALRRPLMSHNRGVFIVSRDASSVLGAMDRYANTKNGSGSDRGDMLLLWDGGVNVIGRGAKDFAVQNFSAGLLFGITPSSLRKALGQELHGDGFMHRFFTCVCRPARAEVQRRPDQDAEDAFVAMLRHLHAESALSDRSLITASEESAYILSEFNDRVMSIADSSELPAHMGAALGKWRGMVARVCLCLHLAEAAHHKTYPSPVIERETALMATHIFEWQFAHLMEFWGRVLENQTGVQSESWVTKIAEFIASKPRTHLKMRDLDNRFSRAWPGLEHKTKVAAMQWLENSSWLMTDPQARVVRQGLSSSYLVNPEIFPMYADDDNLERRNAQKAAISTFLQGKRDQAAIRRQQ